MLTKFLPVFPIFGDGKSPYRESFVVVFITFVIIPSAFKEPIYIKDLARIIVNAATWHPSETAAKMPPVCTVEVGGPAGRCKKWRPP